MAERYGKGNVDRVGRLWVLHLGGTPFERGLQQGTLMRYRIRDTINFYRTLPERLAGKAAPPGTARLRAMRRLKRALVGRLIKNEASEAMEEMRGLAVGLGMRPEDVAEALVISDVFQSVGALAEKKRRAGPPVIPGFGCTSAVRKTHSGALFARNFDFYGAGYWDSNPAVIFHHPDTGRSFCSIGTAGLPCAGVTAVNEDGLAAAVHQHGSRDSSLKGTPVLDILYNIIRDAGTPEEAVEVASRFRATGGWTIVAAGGGTGAAVAIEMSSSGQKPRWMDGHELVATNCFRDPELLQRELQANVSSVLSDRARFDRAAELAGMSRPGAARMASLLGDHLDPYAGRERSAGFTISRITNLSSVVFDLGERLFWVSESPAPSSKGALVGFELDAELQGRKSSVSRLEGGRPPSARTTSAQDHYLDAYKEYVETGDLNRIMLVLDECSEADPGEPSFAFMSGITRAMVGNYRGALSSIERALDLERVAPKTYVERLWKARVLDLLDRRERSSRIYEDLLADDECPRIVSRGASRGARKPFPEKALETVMLDFTNADTFE